MNCGNTNVRFERRLLSTPSSPFPAHSSHLRCLLTQFIRCLPIVLALIVVSEIYLARSLETLMSLHQPVFVMLYASLHVKEAWVLFSLICKKVYILNDSNISVLSF